MQCVPIGTLCNYNLVIQAPVKTGKTIAVLTTIISKLLNSGGLGIIVVSTKSRVNLIEQLLKRLLLSINEISVTRKIDPSKKSGNLLVTTLDDIDNISESNALSCALLDLGAIVSLDYNSKLDTLLQDLKCQKIITTSTSSCNNIAISNYIKVTFNYEKLFANDVAILWLEALEKKKWLFTFVTRNANKKILVFVDRNDAADMLAESIKGHMYGNNTVASLHAGKKQRDIDSIGQAFAFGEQSTVLVTTPVMASGISLLEPDYVIVFDLPPSLSDYKLMVQHPRCTTLVNDSVENLNQIFLKEAIVAPKELVYKLHPERVREDRKAVAALALDSQKKFSIS